MTGQERCQHCGKDTVRSATRRHRLRASTGFVSEWWALTVCYAGGVSGCRPFGGHGGVLWGGGGVGEGMGTSNFFVCEELFFREGVFRVKFAMESDTLVVLGQRSQTESEDLGVLVRRLFEAAEPLSGQVNGPARAAFDKFKVSVDEISASLNSALAGIVGSISGQNRAFVTAAEDGASVHASAEGAADFSAGGFLSRIGPR